MSLVTTQPAPSRGTAGTMQRIGSALAAPNPADAARATVSFPRRPMTFPH
ncbi:hypothetical protein [Mycobacterium noviomagense]|nr:hypothetical protein [Mycobacterium noviomagense]